MKKAAILGLSLGAMVAATPLIAQITQTPIAPIETESGMVAGKVLASGVRAWFGVPFAKPPINDLRWQPPQPMTWKGVWTADRKMPECMQVLRPHNMNHYFGEEATAEDCLYLNVWAPPGSKASDHLPVIVFIYGGGGTIGSASSPMYDGENMAKKGVVFVTIAYRVGILGWMAHPELTKEQGGHSGNYGYLDQNAALRWIHANIADFGGDPTHVVITGQSAGAGSVAAQLHSPMSRGLFWAAMMSSTCSIGVPGAGTSLVDAEKTGLEIQRRLGASSIEDLRYVPADKIIQLQNENQLGYHVNTGVRTGPITDGYFTLGSKEEMAKTHQMSDVPIIGNFNSGESSSPLQQATTVAEYKAMAQKLFGADAATFLKLYLVNSDADLHAVIAKVAREAAIANATRNCGMNQTKYNKSAAYLDMFNHRYTFPAGVKIADVNTETVGVYHNADIPYWFGNLDIFNLFRKTRVLTTDDRALSSEMQDMLVAFAKTGNPSTAQVKWAAWTPKNDAFLDIGQTDIKMEAFNEKGMAFLAAHPVTGSTPGGGQGAPGVIAGAAPRD